MMLGRDSAEPWPRAPWGTRSPFACSRRRRHPLGARSLGRPGHRRRDRQRSAPTPARTVLALALALPVRSLLGTCAGSSPARPAAAVAAGRRIHARARLGPAGLLPVLRPPPDPPGDEHRPSGRGGDRGRQPLQRGGQLGPDLRPSRCSRPGGRRLGLGDLARPLGHVRLSSLAPPAGPPLHFQRWRASTRGPWTWRATCGFSGSACRSASINRSRSSSSRPSP